MYWSISNKIITIRQDGEEAIVGDLNAIDEEDSLLRWHEAEIHGVGSRPNMPRPKHLVEALGLDFLDGIGHALHLQCARVSEEENREARAPE